MDIDLGKTAVANVNVNGESYELKLPTVMQAQNLEKQIKKSDGDEAMVFLKLVTELGLPKNVAESLDVHQCKKLSDGLLGLAEKK